MNAPQLFAATVTPLTAGGDALDEPAIEPLVRFMLAGGVDGTFLCGTTGEGFLLSTGERRRAAECFRAAGDGILIVHCGAQTTAETVELAAHAAGVGADGVAVIPPPYFPLDDIALIDHLAAAANACAPTPFYMYAFTERSGYPLLPPVVEAVRDRTTNVAGMKVSDHSIEGVQKYLDLGLPVFVGSEVVIPDALAAGAAGAVSGLATAFPEAVAALVRTPGTATAARVAELSESFDTTAFIAGLKHVLIERGVPIGPSVRPPQRLLLDAERVAVERAAAGERGGVPS
jgi:dihydrodipicolinate synthase/N-acetylneuraminate lyase